MGLGQPSAKVFPYEIWFQPDDTNRYGAVCLARYETDYLATRCAGLIRVCITDGDVSVRFNAAAVPVS